jgi:hypothetical protein
MSFIWKKLLISDDNFCIDRSIDVKLFFIASLLATGSLAKRALA